MFRPQSGHHRLHLNLLDGPIKNVPHQMQIPEGPLFTGERSEQSPIFCLVWGISYIYLDTKISLQEELSRIKYVLK